MFVRKDEERKPFSLMWLEGLFFARIRRRRSYGGDFDYGKAEAGR